MTNATEFRAPVEEVSGAESFEVFNNIVRRELGLSGNDFLTRYDAGFYECARSGRSVRESPYGACCVGETGVEVVPVATDRCDLLAVTDERSDR